MTKTMIRSLALGILVAVIAMPLHAQMAPDSSASSDNKDDTVAKVRTDGGVIMLSEEQAQFQTAMPGERVKSKTRLMVSEDSSATVIYDDGCKKKYDKPGVYEISANCVTPVVLGGGALIGILVAGSVVAIAIDPGDDEIAPPPVSR